jgi:hypothetical protein
LALGDAVRKEGMKMKTTVSDGVVNIVEWLRSSMIKILLSAAVVTAALLLAYFYSGWEKYAIINMVIAYDFIALGAVSIVFCAWLACKIHDYV